MESEAASWVDHPAAGPRRPQPTEGGVVPEALTLWRIRSLPAVTCIRQRTDVAGSDVKRVYGPTTTIHDTSNRYNCHFFYG